jgi:thiamine biosynthesis protein ThiS
MTATMEITLNGEAREVPPDTTVAGLVDSLGIKRERVAVERNREVVRRADWELVRLETGDHIELVHFVGGG